MAEFSRINYDYNSRFTLNDTSTDTTKYVLLDLPNITDTLSIATEEVNPEDAGIIDYGTRLGKGQWVVPVTLYASSMSNMNQLVQNLKEAFNPDLLEADATYGETSDYYGYHPLNWTETVGGTERDFRIYAKSQEIPQIPIDSLSGLIRRSNIRLKVADPRKYLQAQSTLSGAGTANNAGTYTTPVTLTLTATGATSTSLQITNSTVGKSIYITTAMEDGDSLVIDTGFRTCKLNGTSKRSMLGGSTEWWFLNPGDNTISISNGTNVSLSTAWRSAWPI